MTTKTIVVLANSVKKSGRCLAGKELNWSGSEWTAGSWIRPVANQTGAEVPVYSMTRALGREPRLLEIVELPLEGPVPQPDQPENWLLNGSASWKSVGGFDQADIRKLLDSPDGLRGSYERYVEGGFPQRMSQPASLYLIQPQLIAPLRIWTEQTINAQGHPYNRHRRRVTLKYRDAFHEFDITDPELQKNYYSKLPATHEPSLTIALRAPQRTVVCVSLTPAWQGRHYKIAAAFIEPPQGS